MLPLVGRLPNMLSKSPLKFKKAIVSPHVIHKVLKIFDVNHPRIEEGDRAVDPPLIRNFHGLYIVQARFFDGGICQAPDEDRVSVIVDLFRLQGGPHFPHWLAPGIGPLGDGLHFKAV